MYTKFVEIYFADDGEPFFSQKNCLEYEKKKQKDIIKNLSVEIWDENLVKFTLNEETDFNDIYFFRCETDEDFDRFNKITPFTTHYLNESEKTDLFFYRESKGYFITPAFYEEDIDVHYLKAKDFLAEEE